MLDALRQAANRPLRDGDRLRLFACTVAVVVAVVAVMALLDGAGASRQGKTEPHAQQTATATSDAGPPPQATPTPAAPPSEEGQAEPATAASPAEVRAAKGAARRFLTGYLAFSYGRGRARAIRGAAPALKHDLTQQPPRVPRRIRAHHPRVRLLQSNGVDARAATLTALVADGSGVYTLALELARAAGGRWTVTGVES
ncbi:hypothetical protein OM076_35630 [Solirubrobacter ginsenosidimutans]|uniref:Uncharacterized protein n=1 Tax=Solirubrobacter ginsenosidimutans TaxID=490573 RepID=A0A9X3N6B0_9ACTN|nr:hypothetical protein [Solirubrobacter ginsenosidimutans]MDA0165653.1 hypothetical protein [Solirubrobacter ginsenosidimutans]